MAAVLALLMAGSFSALGRNAIEVAGDFWRVHDPSIIKDGQTWYVFSTGKAPQGGQLAISCSEDLHTWKLCGHVFDSIPAWIQKDSPATKDLWAPDISFYRGEYRLTMRIPCSARTRPE